MKRKLLLSVSICVIVFTLVCLSACGDGYVSTLQDISYLLKVKYSEVTLNVTTNTNGVELTGIYTMTFEGDKTTVEYSFDRLNELSADGNSDYKSKVTGVAVVQDGQIVEGNTSVTLPTELDFNGISFKQAFFKKYKITNAKFDADVANPKGFTGNSTLECSNMHVTVLHSKTALTMIEITYTSQGGSSVSITYFFTK